MVLPPVSSACPLSAENFSQRISLIREMRACGNQMMSPVRASDENVLMKDL